MVDSLPESLDRTLDKMFNRDMNTNTNPYPAITYNVTTVLVDTLEHTTTTGFTADMLSAYLELVIMPRVVDGRMILLSVLQDS